MDRTVTAGRISGLFGTKGELTLALYDGFPREPNFEEPVFVKIDAHRVPLFFERFARRGVRGATAVFADIDSVQRASELIGLEFSLRAGGKGAATAEADNPDELYFEDLVGWTVELSCDENDTDGAGGRGNKQKGRITDYFASDLNPLIEVETGGARVLIPAVGEFVVDMDEAHRTIVLSIPEGLLDLN